MVSVATVLVTRALLPRRAEAPLVKFRLSPPGDAAGVVRTPAISPDGRMVAYLAGDRLHIQTLGELEPREVKVDAGATSLFWSPDAKHVGYIAGTRVMKVAVDGGESQAICDGRGAFTGGSGAAWGEGTIVFSRADSGGVFEAPALGGDPHPLVAIDSTETDLHEPSFLPGRRGLLFAAHRRRGGINNIALWAKGRQKVLLELPDQTIATPVYSTTGHILFRRSPTTPGIWALPFSLRRLAATGDPFLVVPSGARPSVSANGWLACLGGDVAATTQLAWVDRNGKELGDVGGPQPRTMEGPALAPDGVRVAQSTTENDNEDIWIFDTARGTRTRLTFEPGLEAAPAWSPDGERIVYHAHARGCTAAECWYVLVRPANGTGVPDTLAPGGVPAFTPDGRFVVLVSLVGVGNVWDLEAVSLDGERRLIPLVRGNPRAAEGRVRPGGDLLAYMSDESGEWQVYLTRFPSGEGRCQVSVAGGQWPRWNGRGDRLYFAQGEDIMEVEVSGTGSPVLGRPQRLFSRPPLGAGAFGWYAGFDAARDGSRFILPRPAGDRSRPPGVTVVQNWFAEFKGRK